MLIENKRLLRFISLIGLIIVSYSSSTTEARANCHCKCYDNDHNLAYDLGTDYSWTDFGCDGRCTSILGTMGKTPGYHTCTPVN